MDWNHRRQLFHRQCLCLRSSDRHYQIRIDKIQQYWYKAHHPDRDRGYTHSCPSRYRRSIHNHSDNCMNMSLGDLYKISLNRVSVRSEFVPPWWTRRNLSYDNCLTASNSTGIMKALEKQVSHGSLVWVFNLPCYRIGMSGYDIYKIRHTGIPHFRL